MDHVVTHSFSAGSFTHRASLVVSHAGQACAVGRLFEGGKRPAAFPGGPRGRFRVEALQVRGPVPGREKLLSRHPDAIGSARPDGEPKWPTASRSGVRSPRSTLPPEIAATQS